MKNNTQGLLVGTLFLLISNLFIKALGFFYRIVLVRKIGTEGMGLIEMIMPLYSFFLVISTCGIPLAVSKIIASNQDQDPAYLKKVEKTSLCTLAILGFLTTILVYALCPLIAKNFIADMRAYNCFKIMIPAIFIIALASAYRGFFQGIKKVAVLGCSQIIEQIVRVTIGLSLIIYLLPQGIEKAIMGMGIATVGGELAGFIFIYFSWQKQQAFHNHSQQQIPIKPILKNLFSFGTPVTATRLLNTIIAMTEALLIPMTLQQSGLDLHAATEVYGRFSGVAMSLMQLPNVFTSAMAVALVPAIAETINDHKNLAFRINTSLQTSFAITLPAMAILWLFATELCQIIFKSPLSAEPLKILALGGVFAHLEMIINSILQGLGAVKAVLLNSVITGIVLLVGIVLLTPQPNLGIQGTAIAVDLCYVSGFLFSLLWLKKITQTKIDLPNIFFKPLFSLLTAYYLIQQSNLPTIPTGILLLFLYFLLLFLLGGINLDLIQRILPPKKRH